MKVEADMIGYCRAKGEDYQDKARRLDPTHDYAEIEVTPEELKWLIDNCVDIKMINEESWKKGFYGSGDFRSQHCKEE